MSISEDSRHHAIDQWIGPKTSAEERYELIKLYNEVYFDMEFGTKNELHALIDKLRALAVLEYNNQ